MVHMMHSGRQLVATGGLSKEILWLHNWADFRRILRRGESWNELEPVKQSLSSQSCPEMGIACRLG